MATDALLRIATQLLRPAAKPVGVRLELMSNEDLDRWLEDNLGRPSKAPSSFHRVAPSRCEGFLREYQDQS